MKCYDIINYCPFVKDLYGSCVKAGAPPRKAGFKVAARVVDNREVLGGCWYYPEGTTLGLKRGNP